MESIGTAPGAPGFWHPDQVPGVDDVRPKRCEACKQPARLGGRVLLQGHGVRKRSVVVPPAVRRLAERMADCWVRRYRCVSCGAVPTVLPRGVMPRYLYSAGAIVVAFFLGAARPVGEGLSDEAAYARQGMFGKTCWQDGDSYRWRSLDRWAECASRWWPARAAGGPSSLLVSFLERAGTGGLDALVEAAVLSHVRWGLAM